jgi:CRISPR-associated protein Csx3
MIETVGSAFHIEVERLPDGDLLRVGFGEPATGDAVVRAIADQLKTLDLSGGKLVLVDGRISAAGAMVLGHHLAHLYGAVAMFDPKVGGYILAISHDPDFSVGDVVRR